MENLKLQTEVINQLPNLEEAQQWYQSLLGNINNISPIKSFLIGVNTGKSQGSTHSNLTIITFEDLPTTQIGKRKEIYDTIIYAADEFVETKFLNQFDILIINFDF